VQPIGAACAHLSPFQPSLGKPPAPLSLLFSLSTSRDFSDVAMLPAGLAGSIILALKLKSISNPFTQISNYSYHLQFYFVVYGQMRSFAYHSRGCRSSARLSVPSAPSPLTPNPQMSRAAARRSCMLTVAEFYPDSGSVATSLAGPLVELGRRGHSVGRAENYDCTRLSST